MFNFSLKSLTFSILFVFMATLVSGCDENSDTIKQRAYENSFKYQIRCYQSNSNSADEYFVNDYSFNGVEFKIPYINDKQQNIELSFLNSRCVVRPNMALFDKFSDEEKSEFKSLIEKSDYVYKITCRNINDAGSSTFNVNTYVANKNEIAFAETEKGVSKVYKITNPVCSIEKRQNLIK